MNFLLYGLFWTLICATAVGAEALRIDATGGQAYAGAGQIGPVSGEVETQFGGYIRRIPLPGFQADQRHVFLDPDGVVARVGPTEILAREVGQVGGFAWDTAQPPNLYLAASTAHGGHIVGRDRDGDSLPDRLLRGESGAMWMPGQWGPHVDAGPGSIWKVDGRTGQIALLATLDVGAAGLGALRYDADEDVLVVEDLHRGADVRVDLHGTVLDAGDGPLPLRIVDAAFSASGDGTNVALDTLLMPGVATLRCTALERPGPDGANARCVAWLPEGGTLAPVSGDVTRVAFQSDPGLTCEDSEGALICEGSGRVAEHLSATLPFVTCADQACQTVGGTSDLEIIQRADWGRGGTCSTTQACVFTYELTNTGPEAYVGPVTLRARMRLDYAPVTGAFTGIAPAICDPADLTGTGCTGEVRLAAGETKWFAVRYEPPEGRTGYLMNCVELYDTSMQPGEDPDGVDWQSSCADIAVVPPSRQDQADGQMSATLTFQACDDTCRFEIGLTHDEGPVALDITFDWPVAGAVTGDGMACLRGDALGVACILPEVSGTTRAILHLPHVPFAVTQTICVRPGIRDFSVQSAQVVQALLNARGIDAGPVDGLPGSKTRAAIEALHEELGLEKAGGVDDALSALNLPNGQTTCLTVDIPAAPTPCLPWEKRDETGACRTPGVACAPGQTRDAKGACLTPAAACPPWQRLTDGSCQPEPLRCDYRTTWLQDGCPCRFQVMQRLTPGQCACPTDQVLVPGKGCKPLP